MIVLILKPSVGLITLVSSPLIFKTIVVFPELSRPLKNNKQWIQVNEMQRNRQKRKEKERFTYTMSMRISFSFLLILRMILSSPIIYAASAPQIFQPNQRDEIRRNSVVCSNQLRDMKLAIDGESYGCSFQSDFQRIRARTQAKWIPKTGEKSRSKNR